MTDTTIRKNAKSDRNLPEKKRWINKAGFPVVCVCGSNTTFQIEIRQIERGIAVMPLVLITTCLMRRNRFLVTSLEGWRTGQCDWYRSSPCAFRTVYTKIHLDWERRFLGLSCGCRPKNVAKHWQFLGCLGESESDSRTVWKRIYTIMPGSLLPIVKS